MCPTRDGRPTEIRPDDYEVVVLENRFPASPGPPGRCEVVLRSTARHDGSLAAPGPDERATPVVLAA
ncbi:hypothetical protein GCM10020221_21780 [Streptomyces thioluteus]|uniref:Uncharacterized protein n=1 Tax=Streptomyces thioluteus TaxID=66431 RepID=A0ABP6J956_STRTU